MPFGIGHPPPTHQMQSKCVQEGSRVPNLQTEFNYLNLFKSYCIFSDFIIPTWCPSSPCCPHIIPTSSPCHPHIIPIVPTRSPCSLHTPMAVVSIVFTPCCPHIVPVIPTSSLSSSCHPHIIWKVPTSCPTLQIPTP